MDELDPDSGHFGMNELDPDSGHFRMDYRSALLWLTKVSFRGRVSMHHLRGIIARLSAVSVHYLSGIFIFRAGSKGYLFGEKDKERFD